MKFSSLFRLLLVVVLLNAHALVFAQPAESHFMIGDALPDAPALAARGEYKVGVRTLQFTHNNQLDILHSKPGKDSFCNRPLKVEIWYPAIIPNGQKEIETYHSYLGLVNDTARPLTPFSFEGRALRNAAPDLSSGKFPLVIVSHGYPGSRYLLTYLTENLASKGYVVAAIDHTESTYADRSAFPSTLLNRPTDILFMLQQLAGLAADKNSFLAGLADADNTALIGYSMGGYGVLNAAGAGFSEKLVAAFGRLAEGNTAIRRRTTNNEQFIASADKRIKAVVAFAPWGMNWGAWDSAGLQGLTVPTFFIAGNLDDISGYENGTKAIYTGAVKSNRYLLTYLNARHNVAPNPPPAEALQPGMPFDNYYHYAEPSWSSYRLNNINQHFVTAFLGIHLKHKDYSQYLSMPTDANAKSWNGFKPRTSTGLELLHAGAE